MNRLNILITAISAIITLNVSGQKHISLGAGYAAERNKAHGIVFELERDRVFTEGYSLVTRVDLIIQSTHDYYACSIDIHRGFRRNFISGIMLEQFIGIGYGIKDIKNGDYWYFDNAGAVVAHGNKPYGGFIPSVSFGLGYNLSSKKRDYDMFWIRPKVYWDLTTRSLTTPYFSLQAGFTHTIKVK